MIVGYPCKNIKTAAVAMYLELSILFTAATLILSEMVNLITVDFPQKLLFTLVINTFSYSKMQGYSQCLVLLLALFACSEQVLGLNLIQSLS